MQFIVDSSRIGELHLEATCYVYVSRLRSMLLKLPTSIKLCIQTIARFDSTKKRFVTAPERFARVVFTKDQSLCKMSVFQMSFKPEDINILMRSKGKVNKSLDSLIR